MKKIGLAMLLAGMLSGVFIYYFDLIAKGEETVSLGPRSGPALGVAVLTAVLGFVVMVLKSVPGRENKNRVE